MTADPQLRRQQVSEKLFIRNLKGNNNTPPPPPITHKNTLTHTGSAVIALQTVIKKKKTLGVVGQCECLCVWNDTLAHSIADTLWAYLGGGALSECPTTAGISQGSVCVCVCVWDGHVGKRRWMFSKPAFAKNNTHACAHRSAGWYVKNKHARQRQKAHTCSLSHTWLNFSIIFALVHVQHISLA